MLSSDIIVAPQFAKGPPSFLPRVRVQHECPIWYPFEICRACVALQDQKTTAPTGRVIYYIYETRMRTCPRVTRRDHANARREENHSTQAIRSGCRVQSGGAG